jgi:hypothetical protein
MIFTPNVHDIWYTKLCEKRLKIHLMHNALDIRQPNLKRVVNVLTAKLHIHLFGKLTGYKSLAVKFGDFDVGLFLNAGYILKGVVVKF